MTNYESTVYTVEDESQETSAAFSTLPPGMGVIEERDPVMKLWHTTTLPDGQSINVSVEFELGDVRGLQSFLNDQFGRGEARIGAHRPAEQTEVDGTSAEYFRSGWVSALKEAMLIASSGQDPMAWAQSQMPKDETLPGQPSDFGAETWDHESHGSERLATLDGLPGMLEPSDLSGGWADSQPRQCPVIYNGIQCAKAEGHPDSHEFVQDWLAVQPTQTGDGATPPTADPGSVELPGQGVAVVESATAVAAAEAPSPSAKKSNRRKKEEIAYDRALDAFRAQPTSQLEYVELTKAAEALRKRFPDAIRLELYDRHVQEQNISALLADKAVQPTTTAAVLPTTSTAIEDQNASTEVIVSVQDGPHFAPEVPDYSTVPPFVPPAVMPAPEQQSTEELQAAAAFPCQHRSEVSGRQCARPAGHELADPPKPHIYGELQPGQTLPVPNFIPPFNPPVQGEMQQTPGFTVSPVAEGSGFAQSTIPPFQIPQPTQSAAGQPGATVLSFQVPPTPEVQGAELQPPAPAAPPWGGQG